MRDLDKYFWIEELKDGLIRIGLNKAGQDELGEIKFVETPDELGRLNKGDTLIGVEASKAVTDLEMPFAAEILTINPELTDHPEVLDDQDARKTWIAELKKI